MTDLYPYAPPWGSTTTWNAAKWNLDYLIRLHRPELDRAVNFAREVRVRLESIFPLMDDLCADTCPWCPDPCCLAAKVWVDFKDLLFLHLCCRQIPPVQLLPDLKKKCRRAQEAAHCPGLQDLGSVHGICAPPRWQILDKEPTPCRACSTRLFRPLRKDGRRWKLNLLGLFHPNQAKVSWR